MADSTIIKLYKGKVQIKFFPASHIYMVDNKRVSGATTFIGILDKSRALVPWATGLYTDFLTPSVGSILTEAMLIEGEFKHEERKEEAAGIGSEIHQWVEEYIKNKLGVGPAPDMPSTKQVQIGVNAFLDWEKAHKVKFISSERIVYSKKYGYVGTMDIEAKVDGKLCLIDLKTSNGLYNTVRLQTAAYVKADEEESGKAYQGRWAIRLAKEDEGEYINRMKSKNAKREKLGKKTFEVKPYQVFEAQYLDEEMAFIDRDFKAFLAAKELYRWNQETNVY